MSKKRLDSWKAIAVFLDRSLRTMQQWHVCNGLPGKLGMAVPSRTYNLMPPASRSLRLSQGSRMCRVVRQRGIGWVVEPGDVQKVVQTLQKAKLDLKRLGEMGMSARQTAETEYSPLFILGQNESAFPR